MCDGCSGKRIPAEYLHLMSSSDNIKAYKQSISTLSNPSINSSGSAALSNIFPSNKLTPTDAKKSKDSQVPEERICDACFNRLCFESSQPSPEQVRVKLLKQCACDLLESLGRLIESIDEHDAAPFATATVPVTVHETVSVPPVQSNRKINEFNDLSNYSTSFDVGSSNLSLSDSVIRADLTSVVHNDLNTVNAKNIDNGISTEVDSRSQIVATPPVKTRSSLSPFKLFTSPISKSNPSTNPSSSTKTITSNANSINQEPATEAQIETCRYTDKLNVSLIEAIKYRKSKIDTCKDVATKFLEVSIIAV